MADYPDFVCPCHRCTAHRQQQPFHPEQYEEITRLRQSYPNRPAEDRWPEVSWAQLLDEIDQWVAGDVDAT